MDHEAHSSGAEERPDPLAALCASIAFTPVATIITDNRGGYNPIIKANAAFCELTGYLEHEVLGRNCRFLAGPETMPSESGALRDAVAAGRPALVTVTNYRKDGRRFLNAVMIAPVLDAEGRVAYFIGSQMEVNASQ